jgi:hypothetical protein
MFERFAKVFAIASAVVLVNFAHGQTIDPTAVNAGVAQAATPFEERIKQLKHMMPRDEVVTLLGDPTRSQMQANKMIDTYKYESTNYVHGVGCTVAGLATLGLGFILCDGVTKKYATTLTYTDDKLTSFETKGGK